MADVLLEGLPVLDLLEITRSTSAVARLIQRDQSSISRIYRQTSQRLGLAFGKQPDGAYRAGRHQALLLQLRHASQWMRLQAEPAEPRWLACGPAAGVLQTLRPLPTPEWARFCETPADLGTLLGQRSLDLAVLSGEPPGVPDATPELLRLPVVRGPNGLDQIWLRSDLRQAPAIDALIHSIAAAYRRLVHDTPGLEWLM